MAGLSQEDRNIIKNHPLTDSVDIFRRMLQEVENYYELHLGAVDSLDQLYRGVTSALLTALQGEGAAYNLRSRMSDDGNVASDLAHLVKRLQNPKGNFTSGTMSIACWYPCCCVREVFAAQPTWRFIHAFAVCGTKMEAWVFDRSGPYSSRIIDVFTDSKQFFKVLVGYTMMSDEELGLDTFIARDESGNKSITVKEPGNSEEKKVLLGRMLSYQHDIVCHGTTCFLANDGQVKGVAKFSWVSDKR
ncbi:hypothetical protein PAAG_11288 [Paracoccidioides lutzii Pb01]|uniref:Fungal-type protein kinase domain-containing protein n=1 Tax=Paracoccidioides lutzii (strain ATCC MYA-826 / Pb01) TaxID=502779 RepID=A0A0A2V325_PARBA|nr:hypothetical protein PAAG_11288 [Paracoccidioides lutzii Pb01]KGQ01898.1 hypothetical protein PAAG_11288 [Paracoccidioides lutzii Pb01]